LESKTYKVWEPSLETINAAREVKADTPCQAAFLVANERKIGHRSAEYAVGTNNDVTFIQVEPNTTYTVSEAERRQLDDSPALA
jgi:hypothetical protein